MKRFNFITGFVAGAMIFGTAGAYAATGGNMIEVFYNVKDMKINKVSKMPTEDKPFIFNGSTYVPLRFVAESLGQEVSWDSNSQSVIIGQTEGGTDVYPGRDIKPMNQQVGHSYNEFENAYSVTKKLKDNTNNEYSNFIRMGINGYAGEKNAYNFVEYPLNAQYKKFVAKVGLTDTYKSTKDTVTFTITADDKIIHTSTFKAGDFPKSVDVDLTNIAKVQFKITSGSKDTSEIGLFDAHFVK